MTSNNDVFVALKKLLAHLLNNFLNAPYEQRREAAIALSKFKGKKVTDFLLETYESDNMQDFLALALGNIDSKRSVELLMHALNDSQQEVRFHAAQALGMLENPEALDILMEALNSYVEASVSPKDETAVENSDQIFFEEDAIISTVLALGRIKSWLGISLLKRLFDQERSARIRASIIMALGMMTSDKLMPMFQKAMRDEDPRVRANAVEAVENLKSSSIVGIIRPYLDDPNNRVKANVAKAIWKYGDFDVSDTLRLMLEHNDKWYRASAAYAIGEIKDSKFIRPLIKALKDEDPDVRRNATNALRKIEPQNCLVQLKPMLDDPNFDVRVEAALAISRCAPQEAAELLKAKLKTEENFIVQATIISCFGSLGDKSAIAQIRPFLESDDSRVVSNSIEALAVLCDKNDPITLELLQKLLQHSDNRVKSTAIRTLWHWGKYEVLNNLLELLDSSDTRQIQSATFVLGEIGKEISTSSEFVEDVNQILTDLIDNPSTIAEAAAGNKQAEKAPQSAKAKPSNAAGAGGESEAAIRGKAQNEEFDINDLEPIAPTIAAEPSIAPAVPRAAFIADQTYAEELDIASRFISAKNYEAAKGVYKKILDESPRHLKAILGLANLCFALKENTDAERLYKEAISINPSIVKAQYNLGTIYYSLKKYDAAAIHLVKALNIYPKILGAYLILGQIYQSAGKYHESIGLFSRAASLSPRNPIIYQKLAVLHMQLKNYGAAINILMKAIEISPGDVEANLTLAYCFNLTNQPQRAFSAVTLALKACAKSSQQDISLKKMLKTYLFLDSIINEA